MSIPCFRAAFLVLALLAANEAAAQANARAGTAASMREAAGALIASVDDKRRAKLVLPFVDARRTDWHYTPRSRPGLSFAELDRAQRDSVHRLLKTALSEAGHRKVVNIIELELVLKEIEFALSLLRDPEKYSLVIFGTPDAKVPWGWRFEGHHLSLNFTVRGDHALGSTPSFFGANPAEVKKGPKAGLRVLAAEEDEARRLLGMLSEAQRKLAVVDERTYGDIITANRDKVSPIDERGLRAADMNAEQRAQLRKLIDVYCASFEPGLAAARTARVDEGRLESVRFAWAGDTQKGRPHYYRVQGPRFLIEYDSSQNDGNHVHTVWRDYDGDFGRDLLRDHYTLTRGTTHRHKSLFQPRVMPSISKVFFTAGRAMARSTSAV